MKSVMGWPRRIPRPTPTPGKPEGRFFCVVCGCTYVSLDTFSAHAGDCTDIWEFKRTLAIEKAVDLAWEKNR